MVQVEEAGVILIHGIGDQGRFEHLDSQTRGIIEGLRRDERNARVTVEIMSGPIATFQAVQDSWASGPRAAVRILVRGEDGKETRINVHEVWWADINERYSVSKQVRFWKWGLSLWSYVGKPEAGFFEGSGVDKVMFPPRYPPGKKRASIIRVRSMLFGIGCFFLMTGLSIGAVTTLLKRLLQIEPFDSLKILVNYLSGIRLYSQLHRGTGLRDDGADFLDTIDEPPRISIRRRMIRTIADVALCNYDRWYVFAHSQGSVIAFNGLMENASTWPGYLDERRWRRLCSKGMAGTAEPQAELPSADGRTPACPVWANDRDVAYRRTIFQNFRGLLTYGCPLEKFAVIWPGKVPVCREPAFREGTRWLNVFDPLDPVSGIMKSWPTNDPTYCPSPENIGYASSRLLLRGHIRYMIQNRRPQSNPTLADGVAGWLLRDDATALTASPGKAFFKVDGPRHRRRWWVAASQWLVASLAATMATAAFTLIVWAPAAGKLIRTSARLAGLTHRLSKPPAALPFGPLLLPTCAWLVAGVLGTTFAVGTATRLLGEEKRQIDRLPRQSFSGVTHAPDPAPSPR